MRIAFIIGLFGIVGLYGQNPLNEVHLSEKEGLAHRWVFDIVQDDLGILWLATFDGLTRYDGSDFQTYKYANQDSNSLSTNTILLLTADHNGCIWAYGIDRVYNRIELSTGKISRITSFYRNDSLLTTPVSGLIAFGYLRNGDLITLNREDKFSESENAYSIYRFNATRNAFEHIIEVQTEQMKVDNMTTRTDGKLWLWGYGHGYILVDTDERKYEYFLVESEGYKSSQGELLPVDGNRQFWYPANDHQFYSEALKSFHFPVAIDEAKVSDLVLDNKGNIWINTTGAEVYHFDTKKETLEKFEHPVFQEMQSSRAMINIFVDQEEAYWLGHFYGAMRFTKRPQIFDTYLHQSSSDIHKRINEISARDIVELDSSMLLMRDNQHELYQIDLKSGISNQVERKEYSKSGDKVTRAIMSMVPGKDGSVWTNQINQINQINLLTGEIVNYPDVRPDGPFTDIAFSRIFADADDQLWWCGPDGIYIFNMLSGKLEPVGDMHDPKRIQADFKYASYDKNRNTIYGSYNQGIYGIDFTQRSSFLIEVNSTPESDFAPTAILFWKDEYWLSTNRGLLRYNPITKAKRIYTKADGLSSDIIYSAIGTKNHLWLATHSGLCQFSPLDGKAVNYYTEDGLPDNEFNRWSYLHASTGMLYFGGLNGIVGVDPDDFFFDEENAGQLNLVEVSKFNQDRGIQESLQDMPYTQVQSLVVKPGERMISFRYALATFEDVRKNQYYHFLEGLESGWIEDGNKNEVRYMQIPPGTYSFRVKATGPNNQPALNEIALQVIVQQYWYKRWWAFLLYIVLLGIVITLLYRYQLNRKINQHEIKRIRELDEVKTRMYTNITHEFRTPLTVILGMNKSLQEYALQGQTEHVLEASRMVERNSHSLLTLINQMLDLSKLESGLLRIEAGQGDIIAFIKYCLESFHSLAAGKSIQIQFEPGKQEIIMDYDPDKIAHIISNLVTNAIKFTPEGGEIVVIAKEIRNNKDQRIFELRVSDTGIGISDEDINNIFNRFYQVDGMHTRHSEGTGIGLSLVSELVRLMKGNITVTSKINEGSEFVVQLPVTNRAALFEEVYPQAGSGTFVSIPQSRQENVVEEGDLDQPLILVVEDNVDVRHYISASLKDHYRIIYGKNGNEGLAQAITFIPDVIISDVMMPEKDGFELCEDIKKNEITSHIPVVLLTGKADFDSKIEGLEHGADVYLTKPFSNRELYAHLKNLIRLRAEMQKRYTHAGLLDENASSPFPENTFLIKVRNIILEHISDEEFNITALCAAMHLSRAQLHRKITAITGHAASDFLRKIKLEKAKELLLDPSCNISEVAYSTGFKTQAHFSRVFAEAFGMAPSVFRERHSSNPGN